MAKELDKKHEDISTFVKMFNGKQINECFLGHLARHPMVFIAKMFEYHITPEGWNAALEFAREGVERDFKCPNLIDIEQMRPERVKEAYIDSIKGRQVSTKNKEMDAFEVLIGLASKGLIPMEVLRIANKHMGKEDFDLRERMISYASEAHKRADVLNTFGKLSDELGL